MIAGQGKEWLMESEPVLSKSLWLVSLVCRCICNVSRGQIIMYIFIYYFIKIH